MAEERAIYNCHMHLFTIDHIPKRFLPLGLNTVMRLPMVRVPFVWLLRHLLPFWKRDLFDRFARFVEITYEHDQTEVYDIVRSYYPPGTKFVVLPMDMAFMGAGPVKKSIDTQHDELAELRDKAGGTIIPFAAVDPRRPDVGRSLRNWVEDQGFGGVKIYPPLGYRPNDDVLMTDIYPYCVEKNLPVMTHCSRGGVRAKGEPRTTTAGYADPDNYRAVMKRFPELRICLGHFGGEADWRSYLDDPWTVDKPQREKSWVAKITDMIGSGEFPNLYTDISYTIFGFRENAPLLKVLLENPALREKILFGSDFYMVENEMMLERRLSIDLRAFLGEAHFWQIACENAKRYLYGAV